MMWVLSRDFQSLFRVTTRLKKLENLEKSGNSKMVRRKSGQMKK